MRHRGGATSPPGSGRQPPQLQQGEPLAAAPLRRVFGGGPSKPSAPRATRLCLHLQESRCVG
ncbi:hypothetical protein ACP70R_041901 [Stipagrostis hirtigluma subsp. patula]